MQVFWNMMIFWKLINLTIRMVEVLTKCNFWRSKWSWFLTKCNFWKCCIYLNKCNKIVLLIFHNKTLRIISTGTKLCIFLQGNCESLIPIFEYFWIIMYFYEFLMIFYFPIFFLFLGNFPPRWQTCIFHHICSQYVLQDCFYSLSLSICL